MAWNVLGRIWEGFGKLTPARGALSPVLLQFSIRFPCIGKTCSTPQFLPLNRWNYNYYSYLYKLG